MMFRYLKSRIAKQKDQISTHYKQIFDFKSIKNLSSNDKSILIRQYESFIFEYNKCITEQINIMKDEDFIKINKNICMNSNLKEGHSYILYGAFLELKKFKDSKMPTKGYDKHIEGLENAYDKILPYLQTPTSYTFPNTPFRIVKTLYERLRRYGYSKIEVREIIAALSSLNEDRKAKPTKAKEPVTKMIDPIDGKTYHVTTFDFSYEIL